MGDHYSGRIVAGVEDYGANSKERMNLAPSFVVKVRFGFCGLAFLCDGIVKLSCSVQIESLFLVMIGGIRCD
jgi:hypothetical protein